MQLHQQTMGSVSVWIRLLYVLYLMRVCVTPLSDIDSYFVGRLLVEHTSAPTRLCNDKIRSRESWNPAKAVPTVEDDGVHELYEAAFPEHSSYE